MDTQEIEYLPLLLPDIDEVALGERTFDVIAQPNSQSCPYLSTARFGCWVEQLKLKEIQLLKMVK